MKRTCEDFRELTLIYGDCVDEITDTALKKDYLQHLNECDSCRIFRDELLETMLLIKENAPEVPLKNGKSITDSVMDTLNQPKVKLPKRTFFSSHFGTIAAAVIVIVVLAVFNNNSFRTIFDKTFIKQDTAGDKIASKSKNSGIAVNDNTAFISGTPNATAGSASGSSDSTPTDSKEQAPQPQANGPDTKNIASAAEKSDNATSSSRQLERSTTTEKKSSSATQQKSASTSEAAADAKNEVAPSVPATDSNSGSSTLNNNSSVADNANTGTETKVPQPGSDALSNPSQTIPKERSDLDIAPVDPQKNGLSAKAAVSDSNSMKTEGIPGVGSATSSSIITATDEDKAKLFPLLVDSCNAKAQTCTVHEKGYHVIPFELASLVGYDDFLKWYKSITDFEAEYTPDNFKKVFHLS